VSDPEKNAKIRRQMREEVSRQMHKEPLYGMLADLEQYGSMYYLGDDYDEDDSDIDIRPF